MLKIYLSVADTEPAVLVELDESRRPVRLLIVAGTNIDALRLGVLLDSVSRAKSGDIPLYRLFLTLGHTFASVVYEEEVPCE